MVSIVLKLRARCIV